MNSAKKSFFHVKLYLEGIRQLKIVGVMGAIIMAGAAFLIPLGCNINNANHEVYQNGRWIVESKVVTYDMILMNPLIVLTFFILTPLMVMILFNFLNRRNACDFYHAIPDTRTCLFVSYGSAVLTWNVGILLLSYIITALSGAMFQYVKVDYTDAFVVFLNCIAGCVFMFGVFAIAMSLTGTIFTNFSVAVMILMVPRIITTVFVFGLTQSLDILPFTFGNSILDDRLNVVTNMVTGLMIRGDYDGLFMWKSLAYTLVVGLLYGVIGLLLFRKRKSEVAASAAVNSKMQCVFRLIPAGLISLLPLSILIDNILGGYELYDDEIFGIVVLYLIAVLAYFIYELITTKKLRNCIKALPGLIWLAVFNLLFFGLLFASYHTILNDVPKVSDVKYVNIDLKPEYDYRYSFYSKAVRKVPITSDEVKELLIEELERNINAVKENESIWSWEYDDANVSSYIDGTTRLLTEFHTKTGTKVRYVYVSPGKMEELLKLLWQNDEIVADAFALIPIENVTSISCYGNGLSDIELTKEEAYEIYTAYMDELKVMNNDKAYYYLLKDSTSYNYDVAGMRLYLNNDERFNVSINRQMPKSMGKFMQMVNQKSGMSAAELLKLCIDDPIWKEASFDSQYIYRELRLEFYVYPKQDSTDWFGMNATAYEGEESYSEVYGSFDLSDDEVRKTLYDMAKRLEGTDVAQEERTGNVLQIAYTEDAAPKEKTADGEHIYRQYSKYCIIDDETLELLKDLY